jgi:hypothetical protein
VAGQHPLAHVAAIGDPDTLGQPRSKRDIDAYSRELYPLERPTFVAHQSRELRREGGIVDVEDFRAGERIGQGFEAVGLSPSSSREVIFYFFWALSSTKLLCIQHCVAQKAM